MPDGPSLSAMSATSRKESEIEKKNNIKELESGFRVLAGFGAIADETPTIETAMALAGALEADITGCFVEDVDLLNLAALPFARAVRPADRSVLEIEHDQMKRQISRAASVCEDLLLARASGARVRCTFQTKKGGYLAEIARETATRDIVVVNPLNLPHRRRDAVSALLDGLRQAAGAVILPERARPGNRGPVVFVASGSAGGPGGLDLAERIARTTTEQTIVLTSEDDETSDTGTRDAAPERVGSRVDFRQVPGNQLQAIADALEEVRPSFVVVQASNGRLTDPMIDLLLRAGRAPLLLLRRTDER